VPFALRPGEALRRMKLKLLNSTDSRSIRIMHQPNSIMLSALHRGEVCRRIKLKLLDMTNWLPIRMTYCPNSIMRNRCRLFERKRSPIGCPTVVGLRTTTPRLRWLREMPQQRKKPNQQQTCHDNQQNRIKNRHVATANRTGPTTGMSQQSSLIVYSARRHTARLAYRVRSKILIPPLIEYPWTSTGGICPRSCPCSYDDVCRARGAERP
jgi:hypothetical protein